MDTVIVDDVVRVALRFLDAIYILAGAVKCQLGESDPAAFVICYSLQEHYIFAVDLIQFKAELASRQICALQDLACRDGVFTRGCVAVREGNRSLFARCVALHVQIALAVVLDHDRHALAFNCIRVVRHAGYVAGLHHLVLVRTRHSKLDVAKRFCFILRRKRENFSAGGRHRRVIRRLQGEGENLGCCIRRALQTVRDHKDFRRSDSRRYRLGRVRVREGRFCVSTFGDSHFDIAAGSRGIARRFCFRHNISAGGQPAQRLGIIMHQLESAGIPFRIGDAAVFRGRHGEGEVLMFITIPHGFADSQAAQVAGVGHGQLLQFCAKIENGRCSSAVRVISCAVAEAGTVAINGALHHTVFVDLVVVRICRLLSERVNIAVPRSVCRNNIRPAFFALCAALQRQHQFCCIVVCDDSRIAPHLAYADRIVRDHQVVVQRVAAEQRIRDVAFFDRHALRLITRDCFLSNVIGFAVIALQQAADGNGVGIATIVNNGDLRIGADSETGDISVLGDRFAEHDNQVILERLRRRTQPRRITAVIPDFAVFELLLLGRIGHGHFSRFALSDRCLAAFRSVGSRVLVGIAISGSLGYGVVTDGHIEQGDRVTRMYTADYQTAIIADSASCRSIIQRIGNRPRKTIRAADDELEVLVLHAGDRIRDGLGELEGASRLVDICKDEDIRTCFAAGNGVISLDFIVLMRHLDRHGVFDRIVDHRIQRARNLGNLVFIRLPDVICIIADRSEVEGCAAAGFRADHHLIGIGHGCPRCVRLDLESEAVTGLEAAARHVFCALQRQFVRNDKRIMVYYHMGNGVSRGNALHSYRISICIGDGVAGADVLIVRAACIACFYNRRFRVLIVRRVDRVSPVADDAFYSRGIFYIVAIRVYPPHLNGAILVGCLRDGERNCGLSRGSVCGHGIAERSGVV